MPGLSVDVFWGVPHFPSSAALRVNLRVCGKVSDACCGQIFCGRAAVTFFWVADMYRSEWRYPSSAHKVVLLDAGHVCQNLYLACEVLGLGTCAIGAYEQEETDKLLQVDGEDRFCVYAAPVGWPRG